MRSQYENINILMWGKQIAAELNGLLLNTNLDTIPESVTAVSVAGQVGAQRRLLYLTPNWSEIVVEKPIVQDKPRRGYEISI